MRTSLLFIGVFLIASFCNQKRQQSPETVAQVQEVTNEKDSVKQPKPALKSALPERVAQVQEVPGEVYPIRYSPPINGIGVLVKKTDETGGSNNDTLTVLNADGTDYLSFLKGKYLTVDGESYEPSEVNERRLCEQHNVCLRQFYPEYDIVHFDVLEENEDTYKVLIDDDNDITKLIGKDTSLLEFYTWKEYLTEYYLSFNPESNPLREAPSEEASITYKYNDYFFKGVEVQGDWMKIRCNSDCKECDKGDLTGWIKWKEGDKLLVSIGIIC